jgi:hypothetical protein
MPPKPAASSMRNWPDSWSIRSKHFWCGIPIKHCLDRMTHWRGWAACTTDLIGVAQTTGHVGGGMHPDF